MTDNEKRAHDIAIASIKVVSDTMLKGYKATIGDIEIKNFQIYDVYKSTYTMALESLNRDFFENAN